MKFKILVSILFAFILAGCEPGSTRTQNPTPVIQPSHPSSATPHTQIPCYQTASTQFEMNQCAGQKAQANYAKLTSLITELKGHMSDLQYASLLRIEADGEKVALEHCTWEADFFEGGSIQPLQFSSCLSQQYLDRIDSLRLNLCEGNGMTGECEESLKYAR